MTFVGTFWFGRMLPTVSNPRRRMDRGKIQRQHTVSCRGSENCSVLLQPHWIRSVGVLPFVFASSAIDLTLSSGQAACPNSCNRLDLCPVGQAVASRILEEADAAEARKNRNNSFPTQSSVKTPLWNLTLKGTMCQPAKGVLSQLWNGWIHKDLTLEGTFRGAQRFEHH